MYREGETAAIELERADGERELVPGSVLDRERSAAVLGRLGRYRRLGVTVTPGQLHPG